jgi:hypothetical protein
MPLVNGGGTGFGRADGLSGGGGGSGELGSFGSSAGSLIAIFEIGFGSASGFLGDKMFLSDFLEAAEEALELEEVLLLLDVLELLLELDERSTRRFFSLLLRVERCLSLVLFLSGDLLRCESFP